MLVLIWVQTICKSYQQMTKVAASKQIVKYMISRDLRPWTAHHGGGVGAILLVGWLVLLLYVPSQQLWSLRDGQFT